MKAKSLNQEEDDQSSLQFCILATNCKQSIEVNFQGQTHLELVIFIA